MANDRHDFEAFEKCCRDRPFNVGFLDSVGNEACNDFGFLKESDVKDFIGEKGLLNRVFIKRDPFDLAEKFKAGEMWVDVYDFWTGTKFGYFALVKNPKNNAWLIKSFKLNTKPFYRLKEKPETKNISKAADGGGKDGK